MQEKVDRRFRRTNRALIAALIDLTSELPYASIQVQDITDRADVGYATFYRHYTSKDDLMLAIFDEITKELESSAGDQGIEYFEQEGTLLFRHVQKYQGLYRTIIQNQEFVRKLKKSLSKRVAVHITQHANALKNPSFPIDLAAHHMVVAVIGLIEWWLDTRMELSVAEMARIYKRLVIQATWHALENHNIMASFDPRG